METRNLNGPSSRVRKSITTSDPESAALQERALGAVSQIRTQFASMRAELEEARYVVACLQSDSRHQRAKQREVNDVPVATLRRQIAYRLHPDRGGDAEIMARLNALFDLIEKEKKKK